MSKITEFALGTENPDIINAIPTMEHFYNKHKKKINKSEWDDLQQDIILLTIQTYENYDNSKAKFSTFLNYTLPFLLITFITRYTGIKVTNRDLKKGDVKIKIVHYEGGIYESKN